MRWLYAICALIAVVVLVVRGPVLYHTWFPTIGDAQNAPRIVEVFPPNGAERIQPVDHLIVRFDRPMLKGSTINVLTEGKEDMKLGKKEWRSETELHVEVKMSERARYTIWLNSEKGHGFVDQKGYALIPYEWKFSTAGKEEFSESK